MSIKMQGCNLGYCIPVSAKNESALARKIVELKEWLETLTHDVKLSDIAYTLGACRDHYEKRLAFIVCTTDDLKEELEKYKKGQKSEFCYLSSESSEKKQKDEHVKKLLGIVSHKINAAYRANDGVDIDDMKLLASIYANGYEVDFESIMEGMEVYKLSMPTYPYLKERYWIEKQIAHKEKADRLHPLLDCNSSTLDVEKFTKTLFGTEFVMMDHKVGSTHVLPGVAYLEMAYAAAMQAGAEEQIVGFQDVTFLNPLKLDHIHDSTELEICLFAETGKIDFEVVSKQDNISILHAQGTLCLEKERLLKQNSTYSIPSKYEILGSSCYELLRERGLKLGPSFQAIQQMTETESGVWSKLALPKHLRNDFEKFYLHPSLMDGSLETVIGLLMKGEPNSGDLSMPFAINEINIYGKLSVDCYSYAVESRQNSNELIKKYDVVILDEEGKIIVEIKGFSLKKGQYRRNDNQLLFYRPVLIQKGLEKSKKINSVPVEFLKADLQRTEVFVHYDSFEENEIQYEQKIQSVTGELKTIIRERGKNSTVYAYVYQSEDLYGRAMAAFLRSVQLEYNNLSIKTIGIDQFQRNVIEDEIVYNKSDKEIIYLNGIRYVREMDEVEQVKSEKEIQIQENSNYLVVGGASGLGLKLAKIISEYKGSSVILVGRSILTTEKEQLIKGIQPEKDNIRYVSCDITNKQSVAELVTSIQREYGEVKGIFQCAGVTKDCPFLRKDLESMREVIDPKVFGTINLDEAFADEHLDFIVCYSSIASISGNYAQCDYSFANRFLDEYASVRNEMVKYGKRYGYSISINWSYWNNGGIQLDDSTKELFQNSFGIVPLGDDDGEKALEICMKQNLSNILVVKGNKNKIEKNLGMRKKELRILSDSKADLEKIRKYVYELITEVICKLLKLKTKDVDFTKDMSEYGFNSLTMTDFTNLLNQSFHITLTPAVFFECSSLEELAGYVIENHLGELQNNLNHQSEEENDVVIEETPKEYQRRKRISRVQREYAEEPIAIVGIAGMMPCAEDVEEYWKNLIEQRDCINVVPKDRWNWEEVNESLGQTISKWGGFMKNIKEFDAEFFGISPREARLMDPQQRLFMQIVWKTIEDAGYNVNDTYGTDMGLFVGVATSDYSEVLRDNQIEIEAYTSTGASHCILANRISYLFNWSGPSEPIDTACSSSLVAIHHAVDSIRKGECSMAIAGGVNVITSPLLHIAFSKAGMLSPDGRCKTFDQKANGYVRGEGVGAILIKPLSKAEKEHDHIYGVIKSTAVNHGGHANSLTAPNPKAQSKLIAEAFEKASISPDTIGYIEAHGTGTNLGDPAEINGLKSAFKFMYEKHNLEMKQKNYCHISSVKTNIGHLEAAAGIASIIKVVMALKYKLIPGNLHLEKLNPYIEIHDSPFSISANNEKWECLSAPRRAGISSFGFGGANAHVVIEEYHPKKKEQSSEQTQLIILSARDADRREDYIKELYDYLCKEKEVSISDIAYTLQVGRKHMASRFAVVAENIQDLKASLEAYLKSDDLKTGKIFITDLSEDIDDLSTQEIIERISLGKWDEIASYFVNGGDINWKEIPYNQQGNRISVPTYPFAKDRYWIPTVEKKNTFHTAIHPLLDQNKSDLEVIRFVKRLKKSEFFVHDHVVNGQMLLPGVAYLEMARAAGEEVGLGKNLMLKNVMWVQPIVLTGSTMDISILLEKGDSNIKFVICKEDTSKKTVFCEGYIEKLTEYGNAKKYDISEIQKRCTHVLTKKECYQDLYYDVGFEYGPTFQVTDQLRSNDDEVIAELKLPDLSSCSADSFVLHPSLLDGAIRNIAGMGHQVHDSVHIPFALGKISVFDVIPNHCYGYSTIVKETKYNENGTKRFHMSVLNENGEEVVRIEDFTARPYRKQNHQMLYIVPDWEEHGLEQFAEINIGKEYENTLVILIGSNGSRKQKVLSGLLSYVGKDHIIDISNSLDEYEIPDNKYERVYIIHLNESGYELDHQDLLELYIQEQVTIYERFGTIQNAGHIKCIDCIEETDISHTPLLKAALAYEKSFKMIDQNYEHQTIGIGEDADEIVLVSSIMHDRIPKGRVAIFDRDKVRYQVLKESVSGETKTNMIEENGVYVITGGTGRIGMMFAKKLVADYHAKLILNGRKSYDESIAYKIQDLRKMDAYVEYFEGDLSKEGVAEELIQFAKKCYGRVDGVLHCSGVMSSKRILEADSVEVKSVLNPKVSGSIHLLNALENENCKFVVLFSSVSALIGDLGGVSYAVANSYMDYLAEKASKHFLNNRNMTIVSINWPLWKKGNMQIPEGQKESYTEMTGLDAIEFDDAFNALQHSLSLGKPQVVAAIGDKKIIMHSFRVSETKKEDQISVRENAVDDERLRTKTRQYLAKIIARVIGIEENKLQSSMSFENYGIDSIMIIDLNKELEKDFAGLRKTLFFEYSNLEELTDFFLDNYEEKLIELLGIQNQIIESEEVVKESSFISEHTENISRESEMGDDIAIIGLNGKYPMANNIAEFWENLKTGKDCITEIPEGRFEYKKYYSANKAEKNKVYCKWGGFIDDVDKFDPMFFKITPKDAQVIDPQERLFLENVYGTLDDAGYTKESLKNDKVGVFVGVMYGHYQMYGALEEAKGNLVSLSSSYASIANRISYYFDFKGPSIAMDTMCSSSLTAIHLACESILRKECDVAIAGGVNITIHFDKYVFMCQQRFASDNGACRAFGNNGTGYVPGEGVGSILLKPLKKAIEDHDNIYGVIKASAINHGGKTSGFSVPSPNAQEEVITTALKKANVNPRTISYVEAHGTGTELGDPIEITGLLKAYNAYTKDKQFCEIGSVKTNIGHAESAAGIASLTKVLLQMKNRSYVPSLHSTEKNANIDFAMTPFIISQETKEWKRPSIMENGEFVTYPRRAGISSFGAGGSNAHLILEEYVEKDKLQEVTESENVFLLSARNDKALARYADLLCDYLEGVLFEKVSTKDNSELITEILHKIALILDVETNQIDVDEQLINTGIDLVGITELVDFLQVEFQYDVQVTDIFSLSIRDIAEKIRVEASIVSLKKCEVLAVSMNDVAYTLQIGREEIDGIRLAIVASSLEEYYNKLRAWRKGQITQGLYVNKVKMSDLDPDQLETSRKECEYAIQNRNMDTLAKLWVGGSSIQWKRLYSNMPYKISLPSYPFEKLRCWYEPADEVHSSIVTGQTMIDENCSSLDGICFSKNLTIQEKCLHDHVVKGEHMLPGVAFLEMAWEAATKVKKNDKSFKLKNVVWMKPVVVKESERLTLKIALKQGKKYVDYEIYSDGNTMKSVYNKGCIEYTELDREDQHKKLDLDGILSRCKYKIESDTFYEGYKRAGIDYGDSLRAVQSIAYNETEVLSYVKALEDSSEMDIITLLYSVMDASLQSIAALGACAYERKERLLLPFALEELQVINRLSRKAYIYCKKLKGIRENDERYDIIIVNEDGECAIELSNFMGRYYNSGMQKNSKTGVGLTDKRQIMLQLERGEISLEMAKELMKKSFI